MSSPIEQFNMVDGIWCKQMHFINAHDIMPGHLHTHNHLTLLAAGRLKVTVNGKSSEYAAPHMIFIHKDHTHQLEALEANTITYCVHAVRDDNTGDIIDEIIVPNGITLEPLIKI